MGSREHTCAGLFIASFSTWLHLSGVLCMERFNTHESFQWYFPQFLVDVLIMSWKAIACMRLLMRMMDLMWSILACFSPKGIEMCVENILFSSIFSHNCLHLFAAWQHSHYRLFCHAIKLSILFTAYQHPLRGRPIEVWKGQCHAKAFKSDLRNEPLCLEDCSAKHTRIQ